MALVVLQSTDPTTDFGGLLAQTPKSGSERVGTYVEIVQSSTDAEVIPSSAHDRSPSELVQDRGWVLRSEADPAGNDRSVLDRLENNDWLFQHLFIVHDGYQGTFEDWLDVALVDGAVPEPESGWDLGGTTVHLYYLPTSMRDAVALGKAQRSMEAVGGDTSVAQIVQRVHEDVEAPISLRGAIHEDEEYSLFRPGHIYQTMLSALADNRHEKFDRSTHFPEINLKQS